MIADIIQIQNRNANDKSKITDNAKRNNVMYGQSDASLTVESAMVLPLVILLMLAFLNWIQFFEVQEESMRTLNQQLRELSGAAAAGNTIGETDILPEQIVLTDMQTLRFPLGLIPVEKKFYRRAGLRMFCGRYYDQSERETEWEKEEEKLVYLAETGSVYHVRADCTYLKLSIRQVMYEVLPVLRNQDGAIYYACEVCAEKASLVDESQVYITDEGNRYHLTTSCRGLLRKVRQETMETAVAEGRHPCSRCGKNIVNMVRRKTNNADHDGDHSFDMGSRGCPEQKHSVMEIGAGSGDIVVGRNTGRENGTGVFLKWIAAGYVSAGGFRPEQTSSWGGRWDCDSGAGSVIWIMG